MGKPWNTQNLRGENNIPHLCRFSSILRQVKHAHLLSSLSLSRHCWRELRTYTMHSLRSSAMRPLSISPNVAFLASSRSLLSLTRSLPVLRDRKFCWKSPLRASISIRNCSSITAKPSSEFHRSSRGGSEPDEKLRALRELFSKPSIGIDAYIVPSQDAHQVARPWDVRVFLVFLLTSASDAAVLSLIFFDFNFAERVHSWMLHEEGLYIRFHGQCWNSRHHKGYSCFVDRWAIFSSGQNGDLQLHYAKFWEVLLW